LLDHIKQSWLDSGSSNGYPKVTENLRALDEACGEHRVYRLMNNEKLRKQKSYHHRPSKRGCSVADFAPNIYSSNSTWQNRIAYG